MRHLKTSMSGRIASLLAAFALVWTVQAETVPFTEVVAAARGWLALTDGAPLEESIGNGLLSFETVIDEDGSPLFHGFYLEKGGVLVLSPDDEIEPVIAFSSEAGDLSDPSPCNHLRLLLEGDMTARLDAVKSGVVKSDGAKRAKWILLKAAARDPDGVKAGLGSVSDLRVPPFVGTRWSQSTVSAGGVKKAVYNFYTPKSGSGSANNYVCGCVATALAQIMRYHKHPTTAIGAKSYSIQVDGSLKTRALRGGDGVGGAYKWWAMPLNPQALGGSLTDVQRKAIGAVCHDAGVASQASYTRSLTYAYFCWGAGNHPLQRDFKYASTESPWVSDWDSFSKTDINQALNPNLDARLPTGITLNGVDGGHAVVCDGYGFAYGALYHHLNMGWAGASDAWYNLPVGVNTKYVATRVTGLVFNIHPTRAAFNLISGRVLNLAGKPFKGVKVTAERVRSGERYSTRTNARGIYAIPVPRQAQYDVKPKATGLGFSPGKRSPTVGFNTTRNAWAMNFKALTRTMGLSTTSMAFGRVAVGGNKSLNLKVRNFGTAILSVTAIECPQGFSAWPQTFKVAANGGVETVKIKFKPSAKQAYDGKVILRSNRTSGPNTVAVTGQGI